MGRQGVESNGSNENEIMIAYREEKQYCGVIHDVLFSIELLKK